MAGVVDRRFMAALKAAQNLVDQMVDGHTKWLISAWLQVWADAETGINTILTGRHGVGGVGADSVRQRMILWQAAQDQAQAQLAALLREVSAEAVKVAEELADVAIKSRLEIVEAQLPPGTVATNLIVQPNPGAVAQIVERATQQITVRHYYLEAEASQAMKRALIWGTVQGRNPREMAARMVREVQGVFNGGLTRAMVIARTEMIDAYRNAQLEFDKANKDVLAGWQWQAELSSGRTCRSCLAMHGTLHDIEEPGPLGHQQCLLPGAIIAGPPPSAATARWYEGEVCDIKTAAGRDLSVTPNHPILTARGWIPAGLLREGDHLVSSSAAERVAIGAGPDDEQIPSLIENVVEALLGSPSVLAVGMPTAAEDFHGDGAGSQVHVVATNGLLGYALDPTFGDQSSELQLFSGRMCEELLAGSGDVRDVLVGVGAALDGSVSRCNQCGVLFSTATGDHLPVGRGVVSKGHASHRESLADEGPGDSEALGDFILRLSADVPGDDVLAVDALKECLADVLRLEGASLLGGSPETLRLEDGSEASLAYPIPSAADLAAHAGQVVTDRVVDIGRRSWQGHVYNLQTETGWYLANSIVVHNCRCVRVPVTKTWAELGFTAPQETRVWIDGDEAERWLERQPVEVQQRILTRRGYQAWQEGRWPRAEWTVRRENPEWRPAYHAAKPPAEPVAAPPALPAAPPALGR